MHVDSMVALRKLIKTNQSFMGGPGSHSQTQAICAAAHGDCYVSKYLWAGCIGLAAMRKRGKSWQPFGCLGIQVCRYSPNIFPKKQKPPGFRLANNRQQIPLIYTFHTCLITAMSHRIFSFRMIAKRIRSYVYWATGMLVCAGLLQFNCCVGGTNMNISTVYNIHAVNISIDRIKFNTPTFVENTTWNNFD